IFMAIAYPDAGFFFVGKSFEVTSNLLNHNDPATYVPPGEVVRVAPWVLVPALGGIATIGFALFTRSSSIPAPRRSLIRMAALFYAGWGLLSLGMEISHQAVPSLFYYVDYLIPAFVLGAIVIVGELMHAVSPTWRRVAAGATAGGLFLAYL